MWPAILSYDKCPWVCANPTSSAIGWGFVWVYTSHISALMGTQKYLPLQLPLCCFYAFANLPVDMTLCLTMYCLVYPQVCE